MKYIIDFEDKPCCDKPNLYRMKHTNSYTICVPREILEIFPRYEESSEKDDGRLKELENLKEGDVVISTGSNKVNRMGLVIFVWSGEEDSYEIVSNYGVVMRRSAKTLFELDYHKANRQYTTEEFFSESKRHADEVHDETAEELSNLQPGDVIYKYVGEGNLFRRMVNFVYTCPAGYELISESGRKSIYSLETLIKHGWHKLEDDLTTKDFYWRLRGGATNVE